jgi:hypothetical protein
MVSCMAYLNSELMLAHNTKFQIRCGQAPQNVQQLAYMKSHNFILSDGGQHHLHQQHHERLLHKFFLAACHGVQTAARDQTGGWRSTGDVLRDTHRRSSTVAARPRRWAAVVGRRASRHPSALVDGGGGPDETGSGRGRWAAGKTGGGQGGEGRHGAVPDGRAAQRRTGEWGGGSTTRFNSKRSTG